MNKMSTQKLVTTALLILLTFSFYACLIPSAHAEKASSAEKGLNIINQVAGFDLEKYEATTTLNVAGSYRNVLPTETIRYTLEGLGNTIEIQSTFTNGSLQIMNVLEDSRSAKMLTLPAAVRLTASYVMIQMAKAFLLNYQRYSSNSFYGKLASTLNNADITKNSTTTVGNLDFKINTISEDDATENSVTFTWSFTFNGIDAQCKCVSLYYKNGFFKSFIDTWNLYPIGSATVAVSKQQAELIAMQNARTYSWEVGSDNQKYLINNFNVTAPVFGNLIFDTADSASITRSNNPLTLYPVWRIGVGLDKYYPGNVYGIYVGVWADTGKVRDRQEVYSTLPLPIDAEVATIAESSITDKQTSGFDSGFPSLWLLAALAAFTMGAVPVCLNRKKTLAHSLRLPKLRKTSALVLCIIMICFAALMALASAVSTVNATDGCVDIWGDSHPVGSSPPYPNPHTAEEIGNQTAICAYIADRFAAHGYDSYNHQPSSGTTPSNVLSYTPYHEQQHVGAATVWFDHGVGMQNNQSQPPLSQERQIPNWQNYPNEFHFMLCGATAVENDSANDIFDYQIYGATSAGNNYFSFISACMSGKTDLQYSHPPPDILGEGEYGANPYPNHSGAPIGMPYAWTHNASGIPNEGYQNPNSGGYCYIGFPWGSPALALPIDNYWFNTTATYCDFVHEFYYYVLDCHDTVNQALDLASQSCFSTALFRDTALYVGFVSHWPYMSEKNLTFSTMAVYGNGNMYLYPGSPDYISPPSISHNVPYPGVTNQQYQFSASPTTDPCGHSLTYEFNYDDDTGWTPKTTHTYTSPGVYTVTARAHSSTGLTRDSQTIVTIGNMLTVQATLGGWIELHPNVAVDGNPVGTAAVHVPVISGSHTVYVDSWIPCPGIPGAYCTFSCFIDSNSNYYYNGQSIPVTSPNVVTGYYNLGW